ncbi:MAG: hypothetical protein PHG74_09275 [Kiritimatiellae bacterium]|nr:hypothetical protein [Kiritimatiellia bacterium]MDD3584193.1 hypothetical protein [Kiritimatiellia bacterium]
MTAIRHSFFSYSLLTIRYSLIRYSLLLCLSLCAYAQTPDLAWNAEASAARPAQADIYRGETLRLIPAWTRQGRPLDTNGWTFTAWWSTNDVQWWSKGLGPDASHTVLGDPFEWTPEQDCGARAYTLFIRAASPDGGRVSYRANARLRLLDSPGAAPNALPLPTPAIDFASIEIHNAPWLLASDWQGGSNALAGAVQALGPRLDSIETEAADWRAAFAWGPHFAAGYLLPADLAPYATTQQVAAATGGKLDAAATNSALRAEWFPDAYGTGEGHLRIADANTDDAVYLGPLGVGQWRRADWENPSGVDRFVSWHDIPERGEIEEASNNLAHVIGALNAADVGALPSAGESAGLAVEWKANVYPETEEGHLRIFDPLNQNEILLGPHGFGQFRTPDAEHPAGLDRYVPWASLPTLDDIAAVPTNYVPLADKELHRDSHTNLIWKSVYSNGWHFLIAYTNTPSGGGE